MNTIRKKKIVYVIGTLEVGGAERQIVEVATRLNQEIFEPHLYCLHGGGPLEKLAKERGLAVSIFHAFRHKTNGSFENASPIPFRHLQQFGALYFFLRRQQPDVVHCYMFAPSIYGGWATKLSGKSCLITSRRCLGHFKDETPFFQMLENSVNRFTDRVLVNSLALQQDVLAREMVSAEKLEVIYNGVDIEKYSPAGAEHFWGLGGKYEFGIAEGAPVIGMIANLFPYKGHREFILAAAEVRRQYPNARFVCLGREYNMKQELRALIDELSLRQHIIFCGEVSNVADWLQLIDIQVSASYEEGFSNVILEGMASGKALVATAVGGTPEAVIDRVTGLLVPPRDPQAIAQAILTFLNNPEFASLCGENARKRIEEYFSMEKMIDKLEKLYLTLSPLC